MNGGYNNHLHGGSIIEGFTPLIAIRGILAPTGEGGKRAVEQVCNTCDITVSPIPDIEFGKRKFIKILI